MYHESQKNYELGIDTPKYLIVKGKAVSQYTQRIEVLVIDSCEYVGYLYGYGAVLSHKGNCKFCAERNRKLLDSFFKKK